MSRRSLTAWGITAVVVASGVGSAVSATAAAGGGGCQLAGTADFAPNGPGTANTFGYSFGGNLTNCQSNVSAPASGTIGAGKVVTASVPLTVTNPDGTTSTQQGTASYQEPKPTGTGSIPGASCAAGSTAGTAVTKWADGTVDVIDYTTQSAAAGVVLQGTVVPRVTLTLVPGSASIPGASAPSTFTISTTSTALPVGDGAVGSLAFEVTDPTQCNTAAGVTSAGIDGFVGVGNTG